MIKAVIFDLIGVLLQSGTVSEGSVAVENAELVEKLKGKYKLGVLSNTSSRQAGELGDLHDAFNAVVLSEETGISKPKKEAYERVLSDLGVSPEEAVFIDDSLENVKGAERLGMRGILYENPEKLKESLRKMGVVLL